MTDPIESLADPTRERLAHPTERPPAELSPRARAITYAAFVVGLVILICVVTAWRSWP